ncbi:MAG: hypothetical protein ACHP7C_03855 [Lysobacterales bacterium]
MELSFGEKPSIAEHARHGPSWRPLTKLNSSETGDRDAFVRGRASAQHGYFPIVASEVPAMSKPSIIAFALMTGFGISATTFAQSTPAADTAHSSQLGLKPAPADHPVIKLGDRNCLRETGSLIRARKGECLPVTGRSYSGDELRRTGHPDTARALQTLDPSVNVGH